mmetsp:Transcript_20806/g.45181  ORF Transcript_20806/g.45181 Transcript_20806/m.45181 type:complete len:104 (-) Transcript_20806:170-481(-)
MEGEVLNSTVGLELTLGNCVGVYDGGVDDVGDKVNVVGKFEGLIVGALDGNLVGDIVVGDCDGPVVGSDVVGITDGDWVGAAGADVGASVTGDAVGVSVGSTD